MNEAAKVCRVSLLIPHPTRTAVLVHHAETTPDGSPPLRLPTVEMDSVEPSLPEILAAVDAVITGLTPVLRTVEPARALSVDATIVDVSLLVEFEPISADAPAGWKWLNLDSAGLVALEPVTSRSAVADWVREREDGWATLRPPWSRPGWFARASAWLAEQMEADGHPLVGAPQQHQLWDISVVLRAVSTQGDVFLKCSADLFRHEAAATQALARVTPALMPDVIAVHDHEGWLLMRDLGAPELREQDESLWNEGLLALASIQQSWLHRTDELIALVLPVRSLAGLASQVASLSDDADLMVRMPADVRDRWLSTVSAFVESCLRLDEIGPGPTLVHGDFHPGNVAFGPGNTRVFDWTDAAVSHPFVDLATFVSHTDDVAVQRRLIDTYVDAWSPVAPRESLLDAAALGMIVGALYQVMTYRTLLATMPNHGVDAGLDGAEISWIKRSLKWQDRYAVGSPYNVLEH